MSIDACRFRRPVRPGDVMHIPAGAPHRFLVPMLPILLLYLVRGVAEAPGAAPVEPSRGHVGGR